jgi:hypothetical protein
MREQDFSDPHWLHQLHRYERLGSSPRMIRYNIFTERIVALEGHHAEGKACIGTHDTAVV